MGRYAVDGAAVTALPRSLYPLRFTPYATMPTPINASAPMVVYFLMVSHRAAAASLALRRHGIVQVTDRHSHRAYAAKADTLQHARPPPPVAHTNSRMPRTGQVTQTSHSGIRLTLQTRTTMTGDRTASALTASTTSARRQSHQALTHTHRRDSSAHSSIITSNDSTTSALRLAATAGVQDA